MNRGSLLLAPSMHAKTLVLKRVVAALRTRPPPNKHTRSSARAQQCTHACHLISTPAQVRPLSSVSTPATKHICSAVYARASSVSTPATRSSAPAQQTLPPNKHTRSSAPAQQCIDTCRLISTPVHAPAQQCIHVPPNKHTRPSGTRSAVYPRLPPNKHTRSSTPTQPCIHACHRRRTLAQAHPLSSASTSAAKKHTCSSAPSQQCVHACHLVSTPAEVRPFSRVSIHALHLKCTFSAVH